MDQAVAAALFVEHVEHRVADLGEVVTRGVGPQELEVSALGAGCLERVVDLGEALAEHWPPAVAVHQPQILERRDVTEIPHERAHQGRVDALEIVVG